MIPPSLYFAGAGLAAAVALAGWIGYQAGASGAYQDGRQAGAAAEAAVCVAALRLASATSHAEAETLLRTNEEANNEAQRQYLEADAARRVEFANREADLVRGADSLRERVRVAEIAAASAGDNLSDGPRGVSGPAGAPAGARAGGGRSAWLFPPGSGADIVRLAEVGERVNAELALCRASRPAPKVKRRNIPE